MDNSVSGNKPMAITNTAEMTKADATMPDFIGVAMGAPGSGSRMYMNTITRR